MAPKRQATPEDVARRMDEMLQEMAWHRTSELLDVGVSMAQVKVLHLVGTERELHMSDIVHALGVSVSTVSEVVERLVERGYVTRHDDPQDRRQVVVALTDAGRDLLTRFRDLNGDLIRELLARLRPADLAAIDRGVTALHAAAVQLRRELTGTGAGPASTLPPTSPARKDRP